MLPHLRQPATRSRLDLWQWDALRDDEADELRLSHLVWMLRTCRSLELSLAMLRLLVVMLEGPAQPDIKSSVASELQSLALLPMLHRSPYAVDLRFAEGVARLDVALYAGDDGGARRHAADTTRVGQQHGVQWSSAVGSGGRYCTGAEIEAAAAALAEGSSDAYASTVTPGAPPGAPPPAALGVWRAREAAGTQSEWQLQQALLRIETLRLRYEPTPRACSARWR